MSRPPLIILGFGEPRLDRPVSARMWGLPWDMEYASSCEMLFEMHERSLWEERGPGYIERLNALQLPIFTQKVEPEVFQASPYPFSYVEGCLPPFPRPDQPDWYNCSAAYMLAYAIARKEPHIVLEGIILDTHGEWAYEQPCLSYLVGVAVGRGLRVDIPVQSHLCKFYGSIDYQGKVRDYDGRYGILRREGWTRNDGLSWRINAQTTAAVSDLAWI